MRLRQGGVQHVHLAVGGEQIGLVGGEQGLGGCKVRIRLLGILHGAGAGCGQGCVTVLVRCREGEARLFALQIGLRGGDFRLLKGELRLIVGDGRLGRRAIRLGGGKGGFVVARIDAGEELPLTDRLVLQHRDIGDIAADFGGDHARIGGEIGVVG